MARCCCDLLSDIIINIIMSDNESSNLGHNAHDDIDDLMGFHGFERPDPVLATRDQVQSVVKAAMAEFVVFQRE